LDWWGLFRPVQQPWSKRKTPDSAAAQQGNLAVLDLLLGAGAAVDWVSDDASTPLYVASWKGHEQVSALFLIPDVAVHVQLTLL
jgi:ankyrin repeat protein